MFILHRAQATAEQRRLALARLHILFDLAANRLRLL
jgi:hypothetical protein